MHKPANPCDLFCVSCILDDLDNVLNIVDDYFEEGPNENTPKKDIHVKELMFLNDAKAYRSVLRSAMDTLHHLQDWVEMSMPREGK